ncbi:hypothetical protein BCIN_03g04580 [Botrytis cinerea B05.10]|uniref:DUF7907 domain-containing protein n=1 Tax=Botryotinia fuckeliana (strain B05.10) TaxID=332648 RepID=A0A384JC89_BOTFB|nr:hypothetical protein BCIN_03g04580 [Botrytis cinerea B05.10]ATZ48219.1 hypothetical protein BCIN_03g04580 [Botrytis cinerea B05.10]
MIQIKQYILSALAPLAAFFPSSPNPNQSAPFALSLVSENKHWNGSYIHGCHTGAARTALCASPKCHVRHEETSPTTFFFNVSAPLSFDRPSRSVSGSLVFNLPYNANMILSQSATMEFNLYSHDFAHPLFSYPPDTEGIFIFHDDRLYLKNHKQQRWYICDKYSPFPPYTYSTLVWYYGAGIPNAECAKVEIKRKFI